MTSSLLGLHSLKCEFLEPNSGASPDLLSRWSRANIEPPRLLVIPRSQQDIQDALRIAKENKLTVVPSGGGYGTFVPIGYKTLYIDMKHFKTIYLDKGEGTVHVGGGVLTGELMKTIAADGYYTPLPSSNGIGVVGCVLGGGNSTLSGLHGWMADSTLSFHLITAEGNDIEVSLSSSKSELAMFHALCGAGHGLGVITSMTMCAYPISTLNMTQDKVWLRSLVFSASNLDIAMRTFFELGRPSPAGSISMTFLRGSPKTPVVGSPVINLTYTFYGPAHEAETEASLLFNLDVVEKTIAATTQMVPFANRNDRFESRNIRGDYRAVASCRLKRTSTEAIERAFNKWMSMTEQYPDSQGSPLLISSYNSTRCEELGETPLGASKFLESRDRDFSAMFVAICEKKDTLAALQNCLDDIMMVFRDSDDDVAPRSFPNNLRIGMDLTELFDEAKLASLREIKKIWDVGGIFWTPYGASGF